MRHVLMVVLVRGACCCMSSCCCCCCCHLDMEVLEGGGRPAGAHLERKRLVVCKHRASSNAGIKCQSHSNSRHAQASSFAPHHLSTNAHLDRTTSNTHSPCVAPALPLLLSQQQQHLQQTPCPPCPCAPSVLSPQQQQQLPRRRGC